MSLFVIIFMIIATIFALASLVYVTVDIILEILARKKEPEEEEPEPEPEPEVVPVIVPVVVPEPEPEPEVMPEIVEHIDAEEADEMISDDLAMKTVRYESPAGHGKQGIINIGALDHIFEAGDVITLEELKRRGLVSRSFGRIKILADGVLNKPLTIKAESYSIQAIKMIELTGGTVIILKD
jgi:ribosomal protein L15